MEVVAIAVEILSFLGLDGSYTITINDLEIFNGIVGNLGLDATAQEHLRELVDTHNAGDLERFLAAYASTEECASFAQLVQLSGRSEVFENARRVITNERSVAALDRLEALWSVVDSLGLSAHFEVDLGDVSRLDYYTGLLFKIYVAGVGMRVGSGGRYDQLTANFGKAEPAVGFVLDLDALAEAMRTNESITRLGDVAERTAALIMDEDPTVLFCEARRKRQQGEKVLISPKREVMP
jgi:ATP phosphoribosyltransferase regulatory subunit